MKLSTKLDYISIGGNSNGDLIDWGRNNIVAYGAQNFVALLCPVQSTVIATLPGHKDRVNHVKWITPAKGKSVETELISASSDHTLIHWKKNESNGIYEVSEVLKSHIDSVTSCSIIRFPDDSLMLASTSADNFVKIWVRENKVDAKWNVIQSIEFKPRMMECCALSFLPATENVPVLALGGVEPKIHVFIQQKDGTPATYNTASNVPFRKICSLQGHQDWVRCLSFCSIPQDNELILASSSQDFKIRLWKFRQQTQQEQETAKQGAQQKTAHDVLLALEQTSLSTKGHRFNVGEQHRMIVQLESVLSAHEDWIYSINWMPATLDAESGKSVFQEMCIISASMDKTMIIWRPEKTSGIWMDDVRVGDMGGNILGLYSGVFSPDGEYILSHGYNGAFHLWKCPTEQNNHWEPQIIPSGHFGPVQDLMWSPDFNYFISSSSDRTLRLFSEWKRDNNEGKEIKSWHEIARPQIHGYDLECFTFVYGKNHVVVSGAEEKILRAFIGSQNFVDTLSNISRVHYENDGQQRPMAANQPSLGLSNKPFFSAEQNDSENNNEQQEFQMAAEDNEALGDGGFEEPVFFNPEVLSQPPFEEHLLQSSLWPEVQKLYGHGNEIVAVACSYDGKYLASTCRASSADQANVRIWNVSNWKEVAVLKGHTLTIVQLAFSHDNRYLLGVSRDRMWTVWERTDNPNEPYVKVTSAPKSHGRIVWGGSWSHNDHYFATGSRDKVVKIWNNTKEKGWALAGTLPQFTSGVTSVEFAPKLASSDNTHLLAVGEEDGKITIWRGDENDSTTPIQWNLIETIPAHLSHIADVRRIRWRQSTDSSSLCIATCSTDHSVRIFTFTINN